MSDEMLIRHCSPTLAGIKTGSLFRCSYSTKDELHSYLSMVNRRLVRKGLRVLPLRAEAGCALIYVFRPEKLGEDLSHSTAARLLRERNYSNISPDRCVIELMARLKRLKDVDEFPHEIELFLGYPPEDVDGFITNGAAKSKCCGAWKVYGDERKAQQTFAKFKKCTAVYRSKFACGSSIERLTVAR